jgi:uncharacterized radical SAM superfamily protein
MGRTIECFYPGRSFPSISVTGTECSLDCKHCSRRYLDGMVPAKTPEDLLSIAEALTERGARGFLLSGGVDRSGKVDLSEFVPSIAEIKSSTDLLINAHVGLMPTEELEALVKAGVDSFSIDIYGSNDTIRDVLGLGATVNDYLRVYRDLVRLDASVAPHICVGIDHGIIKGEKEAIKRLREPEPALLVLISLIPARGTAFQGVTPPSREMMLDIVGNARSELPRTKLVLGCMRSKSDRSWELDLVEAGLDGIVLPAPGTVEKLRKNGYSVKKRSECCALV